MLYRPTSTCLLMTQSSKDMYPASLMFNSYSKTLTYFRSSKWLLSFHPDKCKSMTVSKFDTNHHNKYTLKSSNPNEASKQLIHSTKEQDLGVIFDNNLNFDTHVYNQINKANKLLGMIRRSFVNLNETILLPLFKAIVRPHLEYAAPVWSPSKVKLIEDIERVQRRATKLLPTISHLSYPDRLKYLHLPTLAYRRLRGDMIETFKIVHNIYDPHVSNFLPFHHYTSTRGHSNFKHFK